MNERDEHTSAPVTEPATERQTPSQGRPELTVRQKILVAAVALAERVEAFTTEDLVVRVWELFPESFSLRDRPQHPDSNRVLAKLSGVDGLCGLGWLTHTDQRTYGVTRKGHAVAKQLRAPPALPAATTPHALPERIASTVVAPLPRPSKKRAPAQLPPLAPAVPEPSPAPPLPDVTASVGRASMRRPLPEALDPRTWRRGGKGIGG